MADLMLCQEPATWKAFLSALGPTLAVVLASVLGLGLLRRQERVKRQEEHAGEIRKVQLATLKGVAEAMGEYHRAKTWKKTEERFAESHASQQQSQKVGEARAAEAQAFKGLVDALAKQQFVLGGELGEALMTASTKLGAAEDPTETAEAHRGLEQVIARWLPPLEPSAAVHSNRKWPDWLWPVAILMLEAAVIAKIIWR